MTAEMTEAKYELGRAANRARLTAVISELQDLIEADTDLTDDQRCLLITLGFCGLSDEYHRLRRRGEDAR